MDRGPVTSEDDTRTGGWIQIYSGAPFWPLDPRPEEIDIEDIAHALGMLCRYGGHVRQFYSVAEHSIAVSYVVPPEDALCWLLHDAAEAYILDLVQPVKASIPEYQACEERLARCIAARFALPYPMPGSVKCADRAMLLYEMNTLLNPSKRTWAIEAPSAQFLEGMAQVVGPIGLLSPEQAKIAFLVRFQQLIIKG